MTARAGPVGRWQVLELFDVAEEGGDVRPITQHVSHQGEDGDGHGQHTHGSRAPVTSRLLLSRLGVGLRGGSGMSGSAGSPAGLPCAFMAMRSSCSAFCLSPATGSNRCHSRNTVTSVRVDPARARRDGDHCCGQCPGESARDLSRYGERELATTLEAVRPDGDHVRGARLPCLIQVRSNYWCGNSRSAARRVRDASSSLDVTPGGPPSWTLGFAGRRYLRDLVARASKSRSGRVRSSSRSLSASQPTA